MNPEALEILEKAFRQIKAAAMQDVAATAGAAAHLSYYAMFHAARAVLLDAHGTVSSKHGSVHTGFDALVQSESDDVRHHAMALRKAYSARLIQDYTTEDVSTEAAAELIALATGFVAWCARRLGVEPPTADP